MSGRTLVAGVGNIFLGDDGFGVEVAKRLGSEPLPEGVEVADYGVRGVHLAYQLLEGYDRLILVDAAPTGAAPGTVSVIEPDLDSLRRAPEEGAPSTPIMDAHGMEPVAVLSLLDTLGGRVGWVRLVACEPASLEPNIGLSPEVEASVERAMDAVRALLDDRDVAPSALAGGATLQRKEP